MKEAFGLRVPQSLQDIVQPSRCALIVYNMQVGIVPQLSSGLEIQARCVTLVDAARNAGLRIFHTRHSASQPKQLQLARHRGDTQRQPRLHFRLAGYSTVFHHS
jgi:nicotinamidase-related amidase